MSPIEYLLAFATLCCFVLMLKIEPRNLYKLGKCRTTKIHPQLRNLPLILFIHLQEQVSIFQGSYPLISQEFIICNGKIKFW